MAPLALIGHLSFERLLLLLKPGFELLQRIVARGWWLNGFDGLILLHGLHKYTRLVQGINAELLLEELEAIFA